jgi:hypothetical protein
MLIPKRDIPSNTFHYISLDDKIYIPDYLLVYGSKDYDIEHEFKNVDCVFSNHSLIDVKGAERLVLKTVGIKSYNSISYNDLINSIYRPEYVYIFNKGTFDLEKAKSKYLFS